MRFGFLLCVCPVKVWEVNDKSLLVGSGGAEGAVACPFWIFEARLEETKALLCLGGRKQQLLLLYVDGLREVGFAAQQSTHFVCLSTAVFCFVL